MLKRILSIIIILIQLSYYSVSLADDEIENENIKEVEKAIETVTNVIDVPKIESRYAIVLDRNSKEVLYGKNENIKTPMASTTKIMSSLIVIENTNLNNIVEISAKAANTGGSKLKINKGDKISVRDLLYGLMLRSGNDAAIALAEYISGSVEEFSKLMNEKAEELGLKNTHFETPHGLDSDGHYTTAHELALLTDYALNNKVFSKIVNTKSCNITINGKQRIIANTNELLGNLNGVYGVKTGFTNGAGRCLVTATKRDGLDVICVVLGADTKKIRTLDSVKLIEYTFKEYEYIDIKEKIKEEFENWYNINCGRIYIEKGVKKDISIGLEEYNINQYPIKKETQENINILINANLNLVAPVYKNIIIGEVVVKYYDNTIANIRIITKEEVKKKGIKDYIFEISKNYNNYLKEIIS